MVDQWVWAVASLAGGVVLGAVVARLALWVLRHERRREELRQLAGPAATFLFWLAVAAGVVLAISITEPETIEDVPADLLAYLPRVLAAGLIVLAGRAVAVAVAAATSHAVARALGRSSTEVATAIRLSIEAAVVIVALGQLGVDTTILAILVGAASFSLGIAFALLVGLGGRDTARQLAAGRHISRLLGPGDQVAVGSVRGTVVAVHTLTLEVMAPDGRRLHVPHATAASNVLEVGGMAAEPASPGPSPGPADGGG